MSSFIRHETTSQTVSLESLPSIASAAPAEPSHPALKLWQWFRSIVPTVAVIVALAGLGAWGYGSDWTLPKFSSLVGRDTANTELWCEEHNVPEAMCIECNAQLLPMGEDYGWCRVHGVTNCPWEHPDVAELKTIPSISPDDLERAGRALALRSRAENNSRCLLDQRRIQFASVEALEKAGVDIAVVSERPILEEVTANGEVIYDATRSARLASRVAGTVLRVNAQVGDRVKKGDVLALVDAADVGKSKAEFLQAIVRLRLKRIDVERLQPLAKSGSVPGRQLREAESALEQAKIRLLGAQQALANLGLAVRAADFADLDTDEIARRIQYLGLPAELIAQLDELSSTSNLFPLRSPLDGIVVDCQVVSGEVVDTTETIFGVADVRTMWLMLDVRQEDAQYIALGQPVLFRASERKGEPEITGSISWISTSADDQTRTVKVRANLPNTDGQLRANTFGTGQIVIREEPRAIVIPSEAVHWDGCCNVAFVRDKNYFQPESPKFFHVRKVRLGVQAGATTEIIAGLLPGEVIASKNSVVLEAQLLKSNLGAGCACCTVPK
jgi:cobalt-zinc-cadmium efflux system membrane fusion protein